MMQMFNKTNLPITVVLILILWAWFSLFSAILGKLLS